MADVVDGGTVAVRRLDASSPLTAAQEYEFVVAVGADRVAAVRSDAHIAWLVEDTAKQLKHVAHPTPPRIKGPLRTGGMYPLVRAGPDMRSEILCRYSASIVDYYLAHPSVANVSLEVHSFASAAPPAEISFLMSAGAVDQAVPPQQSMAMSLSKRLTGGFLYPKRKQSVDEKQEESASRNALVSLMPFMRYIDDGTMERHHSAMMAGHIAFEADRRALSEAFQSFGRNLHEAGKAALWDPVSVPRPLQGVPRLPVPPHSDGTLSPKQVDSNRSGSGTSSPVVPAPSGMMATPRGTVFASKLRNREAMRARVNAQLVQKVSPTAAATHDDPNQSSPHTASNSPLASPPGASDAGSAPLCDTASTEAFIQALDTSGRGSTGQQAPVAYLATPRRPSSTVREPVGEGGRKASEPASGAVPDAQRFASCLHTLGHEHVRDALSPEEGAMQRHVGRPRSNSASDVIEVVAKGFEYLAKADEEEVTKHCSRCSLGGTLASNLFAGQLLKGARDVIKQPQSQVDDLQKLAEVRRVKAISDKVLGGTMQVFVENEIKRHSADARVFQHLLDVLDESVEEEDAPGGGDAFLASWNTELPSVGVRSPPTADDIISTATPSPTNENDGSVNVPRLDLSQAGFKATASRRPAEGTDISSDATSFVIVSDREKSA